MFGRSPKCCDSEYPLGPTNQALAKNSSHAFLTKSAHQSQYDFSFCLQTIVWLEPHRCNSVRIRQIPGLVVCGSYQGQWGDSRAATISNPPVLAPNFGRFSLVFAVRVWSSGGLGCYGSIASQDTKGQLPATRHDSNRLQSIMAHHLLVHNRMMDSFDCTQTGIPAATTIIRRNCCHHPTKPAEQKQPKDVSSNKATAKTMPLQREWFVTIK